MAAGHAQHVAEGAEDHPGPGGDGERLVDELERCDADRTSRSVDELDPFGQQRLENEVVVAVDQIDARVFGGIAAQVFRGERTAETAADDDDTACHQPPISADLMTAILSICMSSSVCGMPPTPKPDSRSPANGITSSRNAV